MDSANERRPVSELIKKRREALHTSVHLSWAKVNLWLVRLGKGVFVRTLPTGVGQSLCYALI